MVRRALNAVHGGVVRLKREVDRIPQRNRARHIICTHTVRSHVLKGFYTPDDKIHDASQHYGINKHYNAR